MTRIGSGMKQARDIERTPSPQANICLHSTARNPRLRRVSEAGFQVNFLIIGAQKSGTTALAHFLSLHPEICHSPRKELRFFSAPDFDQREPVEALGRRYRAHFPNYNGQALVGESTPI